MYFKVILISILVVAIWVNVIQPMIEEWLFERRMLADDAEVLRKKECACTVANYRKKYFPESRKMIIK